MKRLYIFIPIIFMLCAYQVCSAATLVLPSPAGRGVYAETGEDATFGDVTTTGLIYTYPVIPYSPTTVLPFRNDLVPTTGAYNVVFARTTKASWTDYDGTVRWSTPGTPRFTGTRFDNGSPKTTTTDGRLIADDPSYLGTVLFVGDSQGSNSYNFPHLVEAAIKGTTVVNDCTDGNTLADLASEITALLVANSPDIVVIEGGFNDVVAGTLSATMLANLETVISACIQYGAEPVLTEITPCLGHASVSAGDNTILGEYNTGIAAIADTYGYKLVKLNQIFEDPTTPDELNPLYDSGDGLHWNNVGTTRIAEEIVNTLNLTYLKGLLIERTTYNRALWSQAFDEGDAGEWIETNVTTTADDVAAPDLTVTADTVTASAGDGTLLQTYTVTSTAWATPVAYTVGQIRSNGGVAYICKANHTSGDTDDEPGVGATWTTYWIIQYSCHSIFLKRKTGTGTVYITGDGGTTLTAVNVTDTWRRFWVKTNIPAPIFGVQIVTNADAVYAWGGQLESGTFPTSYFPTDDTAGGLQRAADVAYLPTTGLTVAESSKVATVEPLWTLGGMNDIGTTYKAYLSEFDVANTENWRMFTKIFRVYKYTAAAASQSVNMLAPQVGYISPNEYIPIITKVGYTASIADTTIATYSDGVTNTANTEVTSFKPSYGTNLYIGSNRSSLEQFDGHIKNFTIYDSALSAAQMQVVTSW